MKVLFVCPSQQYGGGEVYLESLIASIKENHSNIDIHVISVNKKVCDNLFDISNVQLVSSGLINLMKKVRSYIKNNKIDVTFLNGYSEIGRYAFYFPSKVLCIGHSNEDHFSVPISLHSPLLSFKNIIDRFLVSRIDGFICINNRAASNLSNSFISKEKITKIYNGVPNLNFNRKENSHESIIFGRNCRLIDEKGVRELILTFEVIIRKYNGSLKLVIAGDGPLRAELEELIIEKGLSDIITMLGHTSKEEFYGQIDCLLLSTDHLSNADATPLVILESMSAEIPIITTTVGGVLELVNEECAYIMESNDSDVMANAIESFYKEFKLERHLVYKKTKLAKERYLKEFTSDLMTNRTVNAIYGVFERKC